MTYKTIKAWLYPLVAVIGGVACYLILSLALHLDKVYSAFYGVFTAWVAFLLARFCLHLIYKDSDDRWKATMVWGVIAAGLFLWLILNSSRDIQTALVFSVLTSVINYCGFQWIAKSEDAAAVVSEVEPVLAPETKTETKSQKIARLAGELKYRYLEDGKTPNLDAPLCLVDGVALTPKEADAKGYGALYARAIEYIKTLV